MNVYKDGSIITVVIISSIIGYISHNFIEDTFLSKNNNTQLNTNILESEKIQEAYEHLETKYYGFHERTTEEREDAMIDALTKSLGDKHTSYFNTKDAKEFSEALSGDFEGIGAVIKEHQKGIQIMKILKDSPASKSELKKGDIILKINSKETIGMTADDAVDIIRGPKGSTVTLTILSGDVEKEITIKRNTVIVPSIDSYVLTGSNIGYIEVGFFGEHTTTELGESLAKFKDEEVEGIIIDARNNGGGYLDSAVEMLSFILPDDKIVVATRGINPEENITYKTQKRSLQNTQIPIVMLVNNMSASATEIVAGALQDYDRAIIIGQKTYGKGSVQEPFVLSDNSIMKITVAKWFTPKDRGIDEKGIEPDIDIELTDDDYKNIYDRQLEGAKIILQNIIEEQGEVSEYKKEKEKIIKILQDNKILQ